MKPLKIVYLSSTYFADCDFPLIKEFQRQGYDTYYFMLLAKYNRCSTIININRLLPENDIIPASKYVELQKFSSYLNMEKMFVINKRYQKEYHPLSLHLCWKLSRIISRINPDMIIAQPFDIANLQLYRFRNKIQFLIHDPVLHSGDTSLKKRFFRWLCFRLGKKFILLNKNQLNDFCEEQHINARHVRLNRLGIYDVFNVFENGMQPTQSRKNNILFFGRIQPYKGIEYLCKAMESVHKQIPDATLTIAGNGKMYMDSGLYRNKEYIEVINRFIPAEELVWIMKQSTLVCCPYTDATQSGVVMTAFAFMKPVVATKTGGMETYIDNGETGVLIPPCDTKTLANALIDTLNHPERLQTMANNIREKYHEGEYSWKTIAKKYIE